MFKKVFRIFNNGNQFGLNYQIQVRRTILCFIHYWTTPDFAPPHCFDTIDEAKNCIYEEYPDAVIYIKCTDKANDESVEKCDVPLIGLSGEKYNEKFIENIVSGKFLTCMIDFYIFKAGEKYWFEYIGNNNYIGRSDNILNEKIHLEPRQLDYFIEIKDGDEGVANVINWFYGWFYGVRTWGLTNNESNEEFCTAEAINAYKEFKDSFIIQLFTEIYDTEREK